jgi:hypothetical protein
MWVIKKYRMLMCFVRLLLEAFPVFSKRIALRLDEVTNPTDRWQEVFSAHNLGLCRASSIELLLGGSYYGKASSQ